MSPGERVQRPAPPRLIAGEVDQAREQLAEVQRLIENAGGRSWCQYVAGEIERQADLRQALGHFVASVESARRANNRFVRAVASLASLSCAVRLGEPVDFAEYETLIDHWQRTGAWSQQWITIRTLIEALTRVGDDEAAAVLYGALQATKTASPIIGNDAELVAAAAGQLEHRLGRDRFHTVVVQGAALGDDHAIGYALDTARRHASADFDG
jgi:hypothetical protein